MSGSESTGFVWFLGGFTQASTRSPTLGSRRSFLLNRIQSQPGLATYRHNRTIDRVIDGVANSFFQGEGEGRGNRGRPKGKERTPLLLSECVGEEGVL
ncbi:hypothetical protein L873DRAFT_1809063 [Choiromyces venosus 120613-1]|uniref:Uncharacterized protein n=1 Tax=Choiromyces venosus 120613-1 TaxID=1336337 RepID=A0A3N4JW57_9PEZI|nr:hypothetical protein L873DRAFT_1809063 [Choiromyces venosus 120613-1]